MTGEFAKEKFKEQINNLGQMDFKLWLDTTYTYVEGYFSIISIQSRNFSSLISDVNINNISNSGDKTKQELFKQRAVGYLWSFIKFIEEKEKEQAKSDRLLFESINKMTLTQPSQPIKQIETKSMESNPEKPKLSEKHSVSFNVTKELFWIISSSIVIASFFLGLYFGQSKFDKEKIEYYEDNKELIKEVSTFKIRVDTLSLENIQLRENNKELAEKYQTSLSSFNEIYQRYNQLTSKK